MKWKLKKKLYFALFLLTFMIASLFAGKHAEASSASPVNATVKISVCGNGIVESGEDCESGDLQSRTCSNLGYANGNLACDISCSFDTSLCTVPSITPTNIAPTELTSLLPAGYFTIPQTDSIISTSSLTTTNQLTINIPTSGGTDSIVLPDNLVITESNGAKFDPTSLTTADVSTSSLSGFSSGITADGAVQFGISSTTLEFSTPITLNIYVGTSLNGQTLNVVRSTNADSGWTSDGIVSPATCTVSAGLCTFQASKASYFATNRTTVSATPTPTPTPASSSGSSNSTSTNTSSSNTSTSTTQTTTSSTQTTTPTVAAKSILPQILQMFYVDESGKIRIVNIFSTVKIWVDAWKETVLAEIASDKKANNNTALTKEKCDVNGDGECNLKDLSVLLYYVER